MIWFQCKQCGRTHGRAESFCGTLVFCECGQGNRVPWTSNTPEPAGPPPGPTPGPRRDETAPAEPRRRPLPPPVKADPDRCLNHEGRPRAAACDACRESFCDACVVALEGRTLCGPCKEFHVRTARRPARHSALAVVSCLLALVVAGPLSFCLPMATAGAQAEGLLVPAMVVVFGLLSFAVPLTAMGLGISALREIEAKPGVAGRPAALTGTIAGGLGVLWCVAVYAAVVVKYAGG
jgi:hypothetical protein